MWFPDWFYERLPHLYIAGGLICLACMTVSQALPLSALALFGAALLTHHRRRAARAAPQRRSRSRPSLR